MKAERKNKHNSKNLKIPRSPLAALFAVLFLAVAALFSSCALVSESTEDKFSFRLSQTEITLEEGTAAWLHLIKTPADGKKIPLAWRTENEAVATVQNGKITAVAAGETYAEVSTREAKFSCRITVTPRSRNT